MPEDSRPSGGSGNRTGTVDDDPPEVVELRIHGVTGTPVEQLLQDAAPRQVSGDEVARVWRRSSPLNGKRGVRRDVEAFHWGAFTKVTTRRLIWLLLIPFALLNLASFALLVDPDRRRKGGRGWRVGDMTALAILRALGLALTLQMVATACWIGWSSDLVPSHWTSAPAGWRTLVGGLFPAGLIAMLWALGRKTFMHSPPGGNRNWQTPRGSIGDHGFWTGSRTTEHLRGAHIVASLGLVSLVALLAETPPDNGLESGDPATYVYVILLAFAVLLLVVGAWEAVVPLRMDDGSNAAEASARERPESADKGATHEAAMGTGVAASKVTNAAQRTVAQTVTNLFEVRPDEQITAFRILRIGVGIPCLASSLVLGAWAVDNPQSFEARASRETGISEVAVTSVTVVVFISLVALVVANVLQALDEAGGSLRTVPDAFQPFWWGLGTSALAAIAAGTGLGLSLGAATWAAGEADPLGHIPTVFGLGALCWGAVAVLLVCFAMPFLAVLRHRPGGYVPYLLGEGLAATIALTLDAPTREQIDLTDLAYVVPALLVAIGGWMTLRTRPTQPGDPLTLDYPDGAAEGAAGLAAELTRGRARVARLWDWASMRTLYHRGIGAISVLAFLTLAAVAFGGVLQLGRWHGDGLGSRLLAQEITGPFTDGLSSLGVAVIGAQLAGVGLLVVAIRNSPRSATTVGVVFDLLSLWPRVGHPLCPPPYGGRAVLGVANRVSQLAERRDRDDTTEQGYQRVVVSAHSQGSLIALAATAVLGECAVHKTAEAGRWLEPEPASRAVCRMSMLTYGSQLQFIYARLFPAYIGYAVLTGVWSSVLSHPGHVDKHTHDGSSNGFSVECIDTCPGHGGRWLNLFRWTDPIGGPVLAWPGTPDGGEPAKPRADSRWPTPWTQAWTWVGANGAVPGASLAGRDALVSAKADLLEPLPPPLLIGADVRLLDPTLVEESPLYPRLPPRGHSDYWLDPYFDAIVRTVIEERLYRPGPGCPACDRFGL